MAVSEVFDVFLSYNSCDKNIVVKLARALQAYGLRPWLDDWELAPGRSWQEAVEEVIETIPAAAVLVGHDGQGPWQKPEIRACLSQFVRRKLPVIPVLLPGASKDPKLPLFLGEMAWVDLRKGLSKTGLDRLVWGITSEKPRDIESTGPPSLEELVDALYRQKAELEAQGRDTTCIVEEIRGLLRKRRDGHILQAGETLLGRFELQEPIGQGAFARVWKAYDQKTRSLVAVKVLHGQYREDRTRKERFFRGARQMRMLCHPGIVKVIESECEDSGELFFVMEYLSGGDLQDAILKARLGPSERMSLILKVGEALSFAHEKGVIHRDVKPANVLLDAADEARLTDFDLVRARDTTGGTRTGGMLGTVVYAAPEAMRSAKEADTLADVYGLGMTAVFALYGAELPFEVLRDAPGFIAQLDTMPAVREVLARAVAWEPEERLKSVAEFCQRLRGALTQPPAPRRQIQTPHFRRAEAAPENLFMWIETPQDGQIELWREIQAGNFLMGSPEGEGYKRECPLHRVKIKTPFRITAVPITNAQYTAFDPDHETYAWGSMSPENLLQHPAVKINWHQAMEFCRWLAKTYSWAGPGRTASDRRRVGVRLPGRDQDALLER